MRVFLFLLIFLTSWTFSANATVSSLVADTSSGLILESKNASLKQYPASLTKVMTLYLTFNALDNGLLKMDDMLPISAHAAKQPRSKMFLKRGDTIRVKDAIMALIIKSANDAAVVLAEALAPSEADFAKMMTDVAHQLGLKNTQFKNASGLHNPQQVTTARDMAILTIALINHYPQYYKLFSRENFWYRGKEYKTHNRVTQKYAGAEGLKTGYVAAVGYNIISTAKRKNNRLVSVVIGQSSGAVRDKQVMNLLDKGFVETQKPKSVLLKLQKQGKYTSLYQPTKKPNMSKHLAVMRKRLDETKKQSTNVAKARINMLQPREAVKQAQVSVSEEIEQGDNNEEPVSEKKLSETVENEIAVNSELATENQNSSDPQPTAISKGTTTVQAGSASITASTETVSPIAVPKAESPKTVSAVSESELPKAEVIANISNETVPPSPDDQSLKKETEINTVSATAVSEKSEVPSSDETLNVAPTTEIKSVIETGNKLSEHAVVMNEEVKASQQPSVSESKPEKPGKWGIQVGAFSNQQRAQTQAEKAKRLGQFQEMIVKVVPNNQVFRARIYGFHNNREAMQACRKLKSKNIQCLPVL